jgi:hypothetical protein
MEIPLDLARLVAKYMGYPCSGAGMARKSRTALAIVALVAAIVIIGGAAGMMLLQGKNGTVAMYVKDAPGDWAHVNVTFSEVQIHQADGNNSSSGWHNLALNGTHTIDLAALVNVSDLLAQGSVGAGKYTQIRIVVTNVTGVMTNGTKVNFTIPSGELKTTHPFNVTAGKTTKLTLEIGLSKSITQADGKWRFSPVLGAIVQG